MLIKPYNNINIQILLSDLNTFSYSISWENLFQYQSKFCLVSILLIIITFSVDEVLILEEKFEFGHSWDLKLKIKDSGFLSQFPFREKF